MLSLCCGVQLGSGMLSFLVCYIYCDVFHFVLSCVVQYSAVQCSAVWCGVVLNCIAMCCVTSFRV